jgi:RNA-splicing ligase RtcB
MNIKHETNKKTGDSIIIDNRWQMFSDGTVYDNLNADDIPQAIFDFRDFIIRKGAIRSYKNERMVIPFNMQYGSIICEGKSNSEWNSSSPHGAGRVLSRTKAKDVLHLEVFKDQMKDIYSTSVCKETLDEAPFAYKDPNVIEEAIEPTAKILTRIKPVLNLKDVN